MSEYLPGEAGVTQSILQPEISEANQPVIADRNIFDRLRNKWTTVATAAVVVAVAAAPNLDGTPAHAEDVETAVVGMPFEGRWAYSILTTAACGQNSGQTSHPECHEINSGDWSTDLYAAAGTDVKFDVSNPTGNVSLAWDTATGTCGETRRLKVSVDNTYIGRVSFTHLTGAASTANALTNGMTIGKVANLGCNPGGSLKHVHMEVDNSSAATHACYKDHSTEAYTAGHLLSEGTELGVIGSPTPAPRKLVLLDQPPPPQPTSPPFPASTHLPTTRSTFSGARRTARYARHGFNPAW